MEANAAERRLVAVVADLMFRSRIEVNAAAAGWRIDVAETADSARTALAQPASLVIVDLQTPGIDIAEVARLAGPTPVAAFGKHTDAPSLRAARQAGCAHVLARSEFVELLPELLAAGVTAAGRNA